MKPLRGSWSNVGQTIGFCGLSTSLLLEKEGMDYGIDGGHRPDAEQEGHDNQECRSFGALPGLPCLRHEGAHETNILADRASCGADPPVCAGPPGPAAGTQNDPRKPKLAGAVVNRTNYYATACATPA